MTQGLKLFSAEPENRLSAPVELPIRTRLIEEQPELYVIDDPGLEAAVNAALILGLPLLLTGEAGTGKTSLASRIAWQLRLPPPLKFETKSNSTARDLFYDYDALGRFHADRGKDSALPYITYKALGRAILYSRSPDEVGSLFPPHQQLHTKPHRSVVLIDEIDKAHRDFPNDLLNELDRMFFHIPELNVQSKAAEPTLRPIVVITSNSEKNLPDPFLRRCVYYHIPFPGRATLTRILTNLIPELSKAGDHGPLIDSSLKYFQALREHTLRKKPSTAELVNWMTIVLACGASVDQKLADQKPMLGPSLSALVKTQEDLEEIHRFNAQYFQDSGKTD